jgi:hypothetical protein
MRSPPAVAVVLPLCAALLACGSSSAPAPSPSADAKAQREQAEAGAPAVGSPTTAANEAAAPDAKPKPKFPPEARRDEPPADLLANAVKVGSKAPTFTLEGSTGRVALDDALSKADYVILVFYRGGW